MSDKEYDYTFSGFKKERTKALIQKAYEKCLVQCSGDAFECDRGVSPYWVCVDKLEEFIDFVIEEHENHSMEVTESDDNIRLPDPDKLRLLAQWFDKEEKTRRWGETCDHSVQDDLRVWAKDIETLRTELQKLIPITDKYSINSDIRKAVESIIVRVSY